MKKIIMIKYGELTLKKGNKKFFIRTLLKNIEEKLSNISHIIKYDFFRMFIDVSENDIDKVVDVLRKIFGIYEIVICYKTENKSFDNICDKSLEILSNENFDTFKIETNRSDKTYAISSMDINKKVGAFILKNINNINVDVHNPKVLLNIEIRNEGVYLYKNGIKGLGGYPVGTQGKGLLMLSGGIDSPVAGYMALKKGVKIDYVYFESIPHTSIEARNKVIKLANIIKNYGLNSKLYIVNFTKLQETIYKEGKDEYIITIMRRMMYRIAERIAKKNNYLAIFNGESIGQVASQTLTSIKVANEVTNFPIIRPLASFDKIEVINIAKEIDTYETSILPFEDCCTIFVPKHPAINPILEEAKEIENRFDYNSFIDEIMNNLEIINIEEKNEKNDYL